MKIFTAIALPQEVKDKFTEISRGQLPFPYVSTDNFNITLNFLGELDTDQVAQVTKIWSQLPPFKKLKIEFDKLVKFQYQVHMTLKPNPELENLQMHLRKEFERLGFTFTYPRYYAHMIIGNMHMDNIMYRDRKIEKFRNQELAQLTFIADKIVMFESKLLLHHKHHVPISEAALV